MNRYRVRISRKDGNEIGMIECGGIEQMVHYEFVGVRCGRFIGNRDGGMDYVVSSEDEATYVYGMLKRSLDLRKYLVTLELPGKEVGR